MSDYVKQYEANRQKLIDGHAYDPADEHDACGVGLVAAQASARDRRNGHHGAQECLAQGRCRC